MGSSTLAVERSNELRAFLEAYAPIEDAVSAAVESALADHPELGPLMASQSRPDRDAARAADAALMRAAIIDGEWEPWLASLRSQGVEYSRAGVSMRAWFDSVAVFRRELRGRLAGRLNDDPGKLVRTLAGLGTLTDLALATIGEAYLEEQARTIAAQQDAIRELSTPVLLLRPGLLLLPLIGTLDTGRAQQLTEAMLNGIAEHRAGAAVIDVTGVPAVDTGVANHLIRAVQAARLMGCEALLTGLSAANAQTLVRLGIDLADVRTLGTLDRGVEEAIRGLTEEGVDHGAHL